MVGIFPEAEAKALWDLLVVEEDQSMGVHNPGYTKALLEAALEAIQ